MWDDPNEPFAEAWLARRWAELPPRHRELGADVGGPAIQAAHSRGLIPSLLELELRPKQPTITEDDPDELGRWPDRLRSLRPYLPDDCFPFSARPDSASFISARPRSLTELRRVATGLCAAARALPGCEQSVVTACFADDCCAYQRAWGILHQRWYHDADATKGFLNEEPVLVYSARFRGEQYEFASTVGLLEHDLPAARQRDPAAAQTLVAFTPAWDDWRRCRYQSKVVSDVQHALRDFAAEQTAVAVELVTQEPQFALLLSLPPIDAAAKVRRLTDSLTSRGFEVFEGADYQWVMVVPPGELEFVSVCEPVAPDSDGAVELELLKRRIAEAADHTGN